MLEEASHTAALWSAYQFIAKELHRVTILTSYTGLRFPERTIHFLVLNGVGDPGNDGVQQPKIFLA
jgi:hypothetical protein